MEERYHATTQNRFYPDMSNVNKDITVGTILISPPSIINQYYLEIYTRPNSQYSVTKHKEATLITRLRQR